MEQAERPIRRFRRRTVRIETTCTVDGRSWQALATTLGAGGLYIQGCRTLPRDTDLSVRFRLPGGPCDHEIPARVAWVHAPEQDAPAAGMGIRFTDAGSITKLARELAELPER